MRRCQHRQTLINIANKSSFLAATEKGRSYHANPKEPSAPDVRRLEQPGGPRRHSVAVGGVAESMLQHTPAGGRGC
jgi:hypothetical protein